MAVIEVNKEYLERKCEINYEKIEKILTEMGMPIEIEGDRVFIEITPNRPDMYSIEGVVRAIKIWLGRYENKITIVDGEKTIEVDDVVNEVRPYVVGAIIKNTNVGEDGFESIIQFQEKIHQTLGRKRKKVAIGVHDLDKVVFPVKYTVVEDISFVPLDYEKEMTVEEILTVHPKGIEYKHLVKKRKYPMIVDQEGVVSFPPIINSARTALTKDSKNLFIEMTGTDKKTLSEVLDVFISNIVERGGEIEKIKIKNEKYPKLEKRKIEINEENIKHLLGNGFELKNIKNYLSKMGHLLKGNIVESPPYRIDIVREIDVIEDIAIAYGYSNFKPTLPNFYSVGKVKTDYDVLNELMIGMGFIEVKNFVLSSEEKEEKIKEGKRLKIINPLTTEFNTVRTTIISSLFETLKENKVKTLPIKIFEIGRVYDETEEIRLGVLLADNQLDFSKIRGVLQSLSKGLGVKLEIKPDDLKEWKIFIKGRCGKVLFDGKEVGVVGEIKPEFLTENNVFIPTAVFELKV